MKKLKKNNKSLGNSISDEFCSFTFETISEFKIIIKGGDGTAFTHWEKRIFQNEAMTGTVHTDK